MPRDNAVHLRIQRRKGVLWSGVAVLLGFVLSNCAEGCVAVSPSSLSQETKKHFSCHVETPGWVFGFAERCTGLSSERFCNDASEECGLSSADFLMHTRLEHRCVDVRRL